MAPPPAPPPCVALLPPAPPPPPPAATIINSVTPDGTVKLVEEAVKYCLVYRAIYSAQKIVSDPLPPTPPLALRPAAEPPAPPPPHPVLAPPALGVVA